MAELIAKSPCDGLLPRTIGTCTIAEVDLGVLTSVAPYKGAGEVLKGPHGMTFPAPNRATGGEGARAIWFGRDMALLAGPAPDPSLAERAALTDQSDAWACVTLSGPDAEDVLARLVPVDLRAPGFAEGHSIRTQLQHLNVSITRIEADTFLILAFHSMAGTLVHDLVEALESVAARG
ncbi:MAG: sarcosine oxidase subunit gamma [Pseudomonadota bacterium]